MLQLASAFTTRPATHVSLDCRRRRIPRCLWLLGSLPLLSSIGCGGEVASDDANCTGADCTNVSNSNAGGAAATVPSSSGTTNQSVGGATASGGSANSPVSVILTQDLPEATADTLAGVSFTVANGPRGTAGAFYSYAATPPTRASETNYCGYPTSNVFTCDGYQPGCLTITIDSLQRATASFVDASGTQRFFAGYVYAVKAPLSPVTVPPDYSFIGNFEFTSTEGLGLSITGSFSVRFAAALAASGIQLLIIC